MIVRELLTLIGFTYDDAGDAAARAKFKKLEGAALGLAGVVAGVSAALYGVVKSTVSAGSALVKTSEQLGIGAEDLQKLGYAAEQTGVGVEELNGGLKLLQKTSYAAFKGAKEQNKAFADLGIRVTDTRGKLKPTTQLLGELADRIQKTEDPAKRTALAMKILGRNGASMIPMLKDGSAGIQTLTDRAEKLGFILSAKDAVAAENLGDSFADLGLIIQGIIHRLGTRLIPIVQKLTDELNNWLIDNRELIDKGLDNLAFIITKVGEGVLWLSRKIRENIPYVISVLSVLTARFLSLAAAQAVALAPALLLSAAYFGLIAIVGAVLEEISSLFTGADSHFNDFMRVFNTPINENDHPIVKVLKEVAHWIDYSLKGIRAFKNTLGQESLSTQVGNYLKGTAMSYGIDSAAEWDPETVSTLGAFGKNGWWDRFNAWSQRIQGFDTSGQRLSDRPAFSSPVTYGQLPVGYSRGPVMQASFGDVNIKTEVAPGTSPERTSELVKQGLKEAVDEASRQRGTPRGVR